MAAAPLSPEAEAAKSEANKLFSSGKYEAAIDAYTKALELAPDNAILYSNRSFAHLKLENYGTAIADASKAIECDPTYIKAFYRRGSAHIALGKFRDALDDMTSVVKIAPRDADAQAKWKECQAAVRRQAFEAAIATEDPKSIFETFDFDVPSVDAGYAGPMLNPGAGIPKEGPPPSPADRAGVTLKFVMDLLEWFRQQKTLPKAYVYRILRAYYEHVHALPSLIDVTIPEGGYITVCGDVHGQYYDLLNLFSLSGYPSETHAMLFNGDYVDRGSFSCEVVLVLMCWKLLYPSNFHMARGNHESKNMNQMYGFTGEVKAKYGDTAMLMFEEVFKSIPLCHVINGKIFVTHGGLFAKDNVTLADLRKVNRFREPGDEGLMCEMMWSDPQDRPGRMPSKRGVGVSFGPDVTKNFLDTNGLSMVIRSHEVKDEGYLVEHDGLLATVFSAPNYCDQMGNKGAFVRFHADLKPQYTKFTAVPHPAIKPMAYAGGGLGSMMM